MSTRLADYDFPLPPELIARYPADKRDRSRLMRLDRATGAISHHTFADLPELLNGGDTLVLNETRVIPARVFGTIPAGAEIEMLVVRFDAGEVVAMVRGLKKLKPGMRIDFGNGLSGEFLRREGEMGVFRFALPEEAVKEWLRVHGAIPLPPYMEREEEPLDRERYQTVFAAKDGSCAAPTAGLHFTPELLARLAEKKVLREKITLHVGPGTFKPITEEDITRHAIDPEYADVPRPLFDRLLDAKRRGGRVVAVGTTVTRSLEAAARHGGEFSGPTGLYISPGFEFRVVDALITNFHLPKSSLLVLAAAFAGRERILAAYAAAVQERYRFYSYGDAMLII
ncbi:MAG: tRNA preQ1(34) S-adenosylmethionine ribosyltransferase-isomerase QueA [Nitrospinae bacterium]|nr:tRNA preQ1(34) S-adenosylmethionine ribosyltransferase-isomerase QueA [Nitrospinota bacterium]